MKEDLPEHYKGRIRWMQLACSLAIAFHLYQAMRGFGNLANSDSSSVEEVEEFLDIINNICDSELTMSEYYETKNSSVDLSISYYERYKKIMMPGNPQILTCPFCGEEKEIMST